VFDWETGQKEEAEKLIDSAAHVTRLTVVNNRLVAASMETRAALGEYDKGTNRWTLSASTQGGWLLKNQLGPMFNVDKERIRIITPDVGGGFGMKAFLYAEQALVLYAARKLGRPVKWTSERSEAFIADTHGRDNLALGELALDKEGSSRCACATSPTWAPISATSRPTSPRLRLLSCSPASTGSKPSTAT
jgi:carbon-monoxide dehydrogenase large subunit